MIVLPCLCVYEGLNNGFVKDGGSIKSFFVHERRCFYHRHIISKFLQECVSICAMVAAYDSGTTRANEMLTVLDAILPLFLKQIVQDKKTEV